MSKAESVQLYPHLIGLSPAEQAKGLPPIPNDQCGKRVKTCNPKSGGCGHRYEAGDKTLVCPKCGRDRRCRNKKIVDENGNMLKTCRYHGGLGGAPIKTGRYTAPALVSEQFNRVMSDPEIISMGWEIGMVQALNQSLLDQLDALDKTTDYAAMRAGVDLIDQGLASPNLVLIRRGYQIVADSLDPVYLRLRVMREFRENLRIQSMMVEKEQKYVKAQEEQMPMNQVLEALVWLFRVGLRFIENPDDRHSYGLLVRGALPKGAVIDLDAG